MKISIITNEQTTKLFDCFIKEFAFNFTNITETFLINKDFEKKEIIKNPINNKKLTLLPYQDYLNNEIKIMKNKFYIFSSGLFRQNNEIQNSDVILLFVNIEKLDENSYFKLIKKILKYSIDIKKSIFIPWCKTLKNEYRLNLIHLESSVKDNLIDEIFELDKYQDKEFINSIITKIRQL